MFENGAQENGAQKNGAQLLIVWLLQKTDLTWPFYWGEEVCPNACNFATYLFINASDWNWYAFRYCFILENSPVHMLLRWVI